MQIIPKILVGIALAGVPWTSHAMLVNDGHITPAGATFVVEAPEDVATQGGGMTLSEAVAQVKRRGNVKQVISAETEVSGGRETHVIKVLTKDGQVRTHRIPGKRRD